MKRKAISKRQWLIPNDPDTMSYVAYSQDKYDDEYTVLIKIADCNRCINIYCSGRVGLRKLDRLLNMLQEARDVIQDGIDGE